MLLKSNQFKEAKKMYVQAINTSNDDPRAYLGLMHAEIGLRNFESALSAIDQCEIIARNTSSNKNVQALMVEIIYNKCKLLINNKRINQANEIFNSLNHDFKSLIEMKCLKLYLDIKSHIINDELYYSIANYYTGNILNKEEAIILGELEYEIARYYCNSNNLAETRYHLKKAIEYDNKEIRYHAELLLMSQLHSFEYYLSKCELTSLIDNNVINIESKYYLGLIYFLKGEKSKSKSYFAEAKELNYPEYKSYFPKKYIISSFLRI
ncbi:MAG: tetratricopeptide repeat protein [Flavobacteriaceae bacterium]